MKTGRHYATILGIVLLTGCGPSGPPPAQRAVEVSGKIQLASGAYLKGGTLVLRPVGGIHGASAPIQSDGSFTLVDPSGKKGVVPGKYHVYVLVSEAKDPSLDRSVPARYQSTEDGNSDVEVNIQAPVADLEIRLKS
jgi:hypothetical protein